MYLDVSHSGIKISHAFIAELGNMQEMFLFMHILFKSKKMWFVP